MDNSWKVDVFPKLEKALHQSPILFSKIFFLMDIRPKFWNPALVKVSKDVFDELFKE